MNRTALRVVLLVSFLSLTNPSLAGVFTTAFFTGDADSGISPLKTYTHAIDFNAAPDGYTTLDVNGVQFVHGPPGDHRATLNYNLDAENQSFSIGTFGLNFDPGLSGSINAMMRNFFYGSARDEVLTIAGLSPNTTYVASFYGVSFLNLPADKGARYSHVTDSQGGSVFYDQNQTAGTIAGSILRNTYTTGAAETSITFRFQIDTVNGVGNVTRNTDSYHQYGFTNEVVPEPSSGALCVVAGMVALSRRRH